MNDHERLTASQDTTGKRSPEPDHRSPPSLSSAIGNAAFTRLVSPQAIARQELGSQGAGPLDPDIGAAIHERVGGGTPLAESVRADMESHFGVDLTAVRVHTDTGAAGLNRAVQAEAFTTGHDIFFSQGRYDPGSLPGRELLAHELTHVVQQSAGGPRGDSRVSAPDDAHEVEARAVAQQVAAVPAVEHLARHAEDGDDY